MLDIGDLLRDMSDDINTMSFKDIQNEIRETLDVSGMSNEKVAEFSKKMDGYKQINNVFELQRGRHIRWMRKLSQPTNGAILIDIKFVLLPHKGLDFLPIFDQIKSVFRF